MDILLFHPEKSSWLFYNPFVPFYTYSNGITYYYKMQEFQPVLLNLFNKPKGKDLVSHIKKNVWKPTKSQNKNTKKIGLLGNLANKKEYIKKKTTINLKYDNKKRWGEG